MVKLFVGNIAEGVSSDLLREQFSEYGTVTECDVLGNFGFVHMSTDSEADLAIKNMDKRNVNGQDLNVERSKGGPRGSGGGLRGRNFGGRGNGFSGGFSDNSSGAKSARRAGCTKLHIANLDESMPVRELRVLFERYGRVAECDIVEDKKIAFVHIESPAAQAAIDALNGRNVRGLPLKVQMSKNQSGMGGGDGFRRGFMPGGRGGMRGGFGDRGRGRGMGGFMPPLMGRRGGRGGGGFGNDGFMGDRFGDGMGDFGEYEEYGEDMGLGDMMSSLPPPAKDRLELLELLDRRRRLEALDPYERRLIACPDPFNLPSPPQEYLRLLRERAMVKARLPLPPTTGSMGGARSAQQAQASGASSSSVTRALIARRAAAVAANAREKMRSSGGVGGFDPYAGGESSEEFMY